MNPHYQYALLDEFSHANATPSRTVNGGGGGGGGRPGTSAWGGRPWTDEFDNHMSDDKLDKASRQDEFNYGPVRSLSKGEEERFLLYHSMI